MNYNEIENKHENLVAMGKCNCCNNTVFKNELFVDLGNLIYHFSCHNRKVQKENESRNEQ